MKCLAKGIVVMIKAWGRMVRGEGIHFERPVLLTKVSLVNCDSGQPQKNTPWKRRDASGFIQALLFGPRNSGLGHYDCRATRHLRTDTNTNQELKILSQEGWSGQSQIAKTSGCCLFIFQAHSQWWYGPVTDSINDLICRESSRTWFRLFSASSPLSSIEDCNFIKSKLSIICQWVHCWYQPPVCSVLNHTSLRPGSRRNARLACPQSLCASMCASWAVKMCKLRFCVSNANSLLTSFMHSVQICASFGSPGYSKVVTLHCNSWLGNYQSSLNPVVLVVSIFVRIDLLMSLPAAG